MAGAVRERQEGVAVENQRLEQIPENLVQINERVGQVYLYTAAGFAATFITAQLAAMSGLAGKVIALLVGSNALASTIGLLAIGIALVVAINFTSAENSGKKHALFGLFTVYEGLIVSPLVLINPPAFAAAAATTVAVTAGLGYLATKIQTQFERYEKIMFAALIAIAAASLGSVFLTGMAGAIAHSVSMVGGFALFGAYIIYDMQKMRDAAIAEDEQNFDVIHHTMSLYLDAVNIFVRLFHLFNNNDEG